MSFVPILIPSMCDGSIPIFPRWIGHAWRSDPLGECINQSRSGGGRRAGLEWRMERAEMREFGIGGQVEKLDRLRQLQHGGGGGQGNGGQGEGGGGGPRWANSASVVR